MPESLTTWKGGREEGTEEEDKEEEEERRRTWVLGARAKTS